MRKNLQKKQSSNSNNIGTARQSQATNKSGKIKQATGSSAPKKQKSTKKKAMDKIDKSPTDILNEDNADEVQIEGAADADETVNGAKEQNIVYKGWMNRQLCAWKQAMSV